MNNLIIKQSETKLIQSINNFNLNVPLYIRILRAKGIINDKIQIVK